MMILYHQGFKFPYLSKTAKIDQKDMGRHITQKIKIDASTRILMRVFNTNIFTNITNTITNIY